MRKFIFRVDGGRRIGLGHIARCLTLAKQLRKESRCEIVFITREDHVVGKLLRESSFQYLELLDGTSEDDEVAILEAEGSRGAVVLTDLFEFSEEYLAKIRSMSERMVTLDDRGGHLYPSDIVIGGYLSSKRANYKSVRKQTTFLLGSRYVILDRIFARERMRSRRGTESLRKVLVCFGGSDPTNNTMRVLKGLELVREALAIHVVLGEANTHDDTIREFCDSMTASVTVEKGMDSLCSAMSDTGLAFCSVGNTAYELACLGVPSLLVIAKHEHESNAQALDRAGVHRFVGLGKSLSSETIAKSFQQLYGDSDARRDMSRKGRQLVDGDGVQRILASFGEFEKKSHVS